MRNSVVSDADSSDGRTPREVGKGTGESKTVLVSSTSSLVVMTAVTNTISKFWSDGSKGIESARQTTEMNKTPRNNPRDIVGYGEQIKKNACSGCFLRVIRFETAADNLRALSRMWAYGGPSPASNIELWFRKE